MVGRAVEEHSVIETLDAVEACFLARVEADAEMFVLAAHFADLHSAASLRAAGRALPGSERAVRLGGVGTPPVAEFAPAELGARMRLGTVAARFYRGCARCAASVAAVVGEGGGG